MEPVLPSYGVADIPHCLSLVLARSLSKDLKQRYQHAFELQAAINNFLLNDLHNYKIGSYQELLPKVVEVSESGKAFDEALDLERDRRKKGDSEPLITAEDLKTETDIVEVAEETQISKEKFSISRIPTFFWKVFAACAISLIVNIILALIL